MTVGRPAGLPLIADRPRAWARFGGALYLFIIAAGLFAEAGVRQSLVDVANPLATLRNIAGSPGLWAAGTAVECAIVPCALALAVIEYTLLKPVHRDVALFVFATNVVSITLEAANKIMLLIVSRLAVPGSGDLAIEQLGPLVAVVLRAHAIGFDVSLLVFGVVCLPLGYLIFHSRFLPRWIGVLMGVAGVGYVIGAGSALFVPSVARVVLPWVLAAPLMGELSFCLWLLFKGVDVAAWRARRDAALASRGAGSHDPSLTESKP